MTRARAELLLAGVIIARATSFIFAKGCLQEMGTFNLLAVRFLLGFVLLAAIFWRKLLHITAHTLLRGMALGGLFFLVMTCEVTAIHTADTAVVAALENTAIILVPLFQAALIRRLPKPAALLSAAVAVIGVMLLNLRGGALSFGRGEVMAMIAACIYACAIIATDRFSHRESDPVVLGVIQVGTLGMLALIASLVWEQPHLPYAPRTWVMVAVLAVVCTGFGFTLQPVAQSHTTAERSGLFCALNPAVAAILGATVLQERLTPMGVLGIGLILGSLLLPQLIGGRAPAKETEIAAVSVRRSGGQGTHEVQSGTLRYGWNTAGHAGGYARVGQSRAGLPRLSLSVQGGGPVLCGERSAGADAPRVAGGAGRGGF